MLTTAREGSTGRNRAVRKNERSGRTSFDSTNHATSRLPKVRIGTVSSQMMPVLMSALRRVGSCAIWM